MAVARPLSAGRIVISMSSFREWRDCLASLRGCLLVVMPSGAPYLSWLLCYWLQLSGGFQCSFNFGNNVFCWDIFGVTKKFKPFSRRSFSWGDVLVERLTTHFDLSIVIWFWSSATCFCWSCVLSRIFLQMTFFCCCHFSGVGFVVQVV